MCQNKLSRAAAYREPYHTADVLNLQPCGVKHFRPTVALLLSLLYGNLTLVTFSFNSNSSTEDSRNLPRVVAEVVQNEPFQ